MHKSLFLLFQSLFTCSLRSILSYSDLNPVENYKSLVFGLVYHIDLEMQLFLYLSPGMILINISLSPTLIFNISLKSI